MTSLPQPLGADERSRIEEAHWNPDAIKVWPLGPQGPCLTLRELAAWRAEQKVWQNTCKISFENNKKAP